MKTNEMREREKENDGIDKEDSCEKKLVRYV